MVAIIADIIESKQIPNREEVQRKLQSVFDRINNENKNLASLYTITLGDEFQAVYSSLVHVFEHFWLIQYELYPVRIRFSIGIGDITTEINRKQAIGMDGPAFYNARNGMEHLKKDGGFFSITTENEQPFLKLANNSLMLISGMVKKWNKKRFGVLYSLSRNRDIKEIAELLNISQRAVYKNIEAGSLQIVRDTVYEITQLFDQAAREEK